jgi:1-acyl-sn-glycerol-3-phosphate acyltransferase
VSGTLRRIVRLCAFCLFLPAALPVYPFFRLRGPVHGVPPNVLWLQWMLRCGMRIVGGHLRVHGTAPRSGLLVSNHLSYLDIAVIGSACPCVFVSKAEVRAWPFIGWAAELAGTVFVRRTRRTEVTEQLSEIETALARGVPVVLFPEGTSSNGEGVLPFRSALLQAAVATGHEVTPVALFYQADPPADAVTYVCWWGGVGFLPHLWRFLSLHSFAAGVAFGTSRFLSDDRKSEAVLLRNDVARLRESATRAAVEISARTNFAA